MGASISKNISNAVTKAVAKVSSNIIQDTQLSQDSAQIVSVRNIHGDVHISRNTFTQRANVNMHALLDALSTEEAQQSIIQELAQEAKSVTSGLNVGQFSDAQNTMDLLMEATINLLTTISQTCKVFERQNQTITVKRVTGNVYIQDNVFQQMYDILQNCTEKAASDSRLIQDLSSKLSQTASAKAEGISGWILVALLAVFIGLPVIGGVVAGKAILKFIFPIILVVGIVLLILYYVRGVEIMKEVGFSTFIKQTPICRATGDEIPTPTIYRNAVEASNACKDDATCQAFDWKGLIINDENGTYVRLEDPVTTFYPKVSPECKSSIKPNKVNVIRVPSFFQGADDPNLDANIAAIKGDVYLNILNGVWYQKVIQWQPRGVVTTKPFNRLFWGDIEPTSNVRDDTNIAMLNSPVDNDVYVYLKRHNPTYFYIFRYDTNFGWVQEQKIKGPGMVPSTPAIIDTSGFKEIQRTKWMLYAGIAGIVIGSVGSGITLYIETR